VEVFDRRHKPARQRPSRVGLERFVALDMGASGR